MKQDSTHIEKPCDIYRKIKHKIEKPSEKVKDPSMGAVNPAYVTEPTAN
jgi:hypothetical protein